MNAGNNDGGGKHAIFLFYTYLSFYFNRYMQNVIIQNQMDQANID